MDTGLCAIYLLQNRRAGDLCFHAGRLHIWRSSPITSHGVEQRLQTTVHKLDVHAATGECCRGQYWGTWLRGEGAGILHTADLVDISSVVHAFQLITCSNPVVTELARSTLKVAVRRRLGPPPSEEYYSELHYTRRHMPLPKAGSTWLHWVAKRGKCQVGCRLDYAAAQSLYTYLVSWL